MFPPNARCEAHSEALTAFWRLLVVGEQQVFAEIPRPTLPQSCPQVFSNPPMGPSARLFHETKIKTCFTPFFKKKQGWTVSNYITIHDLKDDLTIVSN